ncbi:MAG: RIP metalloprotease RseP [Deltaproteobacteria bacterium]|nr:RIP metalloprotease RseP [Deltaproteobacteria bacterium]
MLIYFIVGLGLLIFIHELGHFLVAKKCGIRVEKFSLGFGPKILGFTKGETEYRLSLLPLGGYVKMSGEEPGENDIAPIDDPRSFAAQSLPKRISVVLAGPAMNLLLAFVLMPLVFMIGRTEPAFLTQPAVIVGVKKESPAQKLNFEKGDQILSIDHKTTPHWNDALQTILMNPNRELDLVLRKKNGTEQNLKVALSSAQEGKIGFLGVEPSLFIGNDPVIDQVAPDSPADKAGLKSKDKILSIAGQAIETWQEMSEQIAKSEGKTISLEILRSEQKLNVSLVPQYSEANKKWILGVTKEVRSEDFVKHRYGFVDAIKKGFEETGRLFGLTFEVLKKLFSFQLSYKALGGPIQIAQATSQAAKSGFGDFLFFLSFLSLQLGVMNLLPIPVLDGGHFFFMLYEAIRRKPLSVQKRLIAQQIGMALLFTLMILVTINDIDSVWGFKKMFSKILGFFG